MIFNNYVMKKFSLKFLCTLLFTLAFLNISGQNKILKKSIVWKKDYKLSRKDFKGKFDKKSKIIAQTGVNIIIVPFAKKSGKYLYEVYAKFYYYKSWINSNSNILLNHEQLHFDIAELYARKMRKEIQKVKLTKNKVEEFDYRRIYKKYFKEFLNYQKKYDAETDFSRTHSSQKKWETTVSKQLFELEKYALK